MSFVTLKLPIRQADLNRVPPDCPRIQFASYGGTPATDADLSLVRGFLAARPDVMLRIFGHTTIRNLDFLERFSFLRKFAVDVWNLEDMTGLRHLSPEWLGIGATKSKKHSMDLLSNFTGLRSLHIEGHRKGIESIRALAELEELTLRSITLPDLSLLTPLRKLRSFGLKLGGTRNLSHLAEVPLTYLEIWMVKGLTDLSCVSEITTLEYLFLQAVKNVTELPDLSKLDRLRIVHLEKMKGITDLSPLLTAKALEDLRVIDASHLKPEDFEVLRPLKLKEGLIGLGSLKKNRLVSERLGI